MSGRSILLLLAWWNVAIHLAGLVCAALAIRPGSPLVSLDERREYLAAHMVSWSAAWLVWMLCALSLVAFLAVLVPLGPERATVRKLALVLAIVGAAVDLLCDALLVTILPALARAEPFPSDLFLELERDLVTGGTVVANGLYSLAVLIMTLSLAASGRRPATVRVLGLLTFLAGATMVVGGLGHWPVVIALATPQVILFFCLWTLMVAAHLSPSARDELHAATAASDPEP